MLWRHYTGAVGISVATIVLAVSGTLGNVCTTQVTSMLGFASGHELELFLGTLFLGSVIFFGQTAADLKQREAANAEFTAQNSALAEQNRQLEQHILRSKEDFIAQTGSLAEQNRKLEEHILRSQTMPPGAFVRTLGAVSEQVLQLMRSALSQNNKEQVEGAIRVALEGVVTLAESYQLALKATFGANVMLPIRDPRNQEWSNKLRFVARGRAGAPLLESVSCLLAFTSRLSWPMSTRLRDFAMPIPTESGSKKRGNQGGWSVLPGAPFAFAVGEVDFFADTSQIEEWFTAEGDGFRSAIKEEVIKYFKDHPETTTFVAMPLFAPGSAEGDREVAGVLNIHWDEKTRLNQPETLHLFAEAIRPLRAVLAMLIQELGALNPSQPPVLPVPVSDS